MWAGRAPCPPPRVPMGAELSSPESAFPMGQAGSSQTPRWEGPQHAASLAPPVGRLPWVSSEAIVQSSCSSGSLGLGL